MDLYDSTPYSKATLEILKKIEAAIPEAFRETVDIFIAGGSALHFLTKARVSDDLDAFFSHKVIPPQDLICSYQEGEQTRFVEFDYNYTPDFGVLHPDYKERAIVLNNGSHRLQMNILSPVDLAITKLSRFSERDREDISLLVERGLLDDQFETLANEALSYYVGSTDFIQHNISDVSQFIQDAKAGMDTIDLEQWRQRNTSTTSPDPDDKP